MRAYMCRLQGHEGSMVDIEAQAGTSPGASPRIKAHHGDTTDQKQQQKSTSILMTLLVIAAWCASLLFVCMTLTSGDGVNAWCPHRHWLTVLLWR